MGRKVEIDRESQTIRATRSLRESGSSSVVTIPNEVIQSVGFEHGDNIAIEADMFGDEIRLRRVSDQEDHD
ncbi:hypothetical protein GCM10009646_79140 [Streptomyces aureus]